MSIVINNDKIQVIKLGNEVKDNITGFKGIATAKCEYLNGCVQYCITPKVAKDGSYVDGIYFDIERIIKLGKGVVKEEIKPKSIDKKPGGADNKEHKRYNTPKY